MQRKLKAVPLLLLLLLLWTSVSSAQSDQRTPAADIFQKTINAIGYPVGQSTKVDLKGAELMPQGNGGVQSEAFEPARRRYLINQGLTDTNVTASGIGKADPVASNDTPSGRQQNRRVEIIVSGEVIGMKIGT